MQTKYKYSLKNKIVRNPLAIIKSLSIFLNKEKSLFNEHKYVDSLEEIIDVLKNNQCKSIELNYLQKEDIEQIINVCKDYVEYIDLFYCSCDLSILKDCHNLKNVKCSGLENFTSLWDMTSNKNLSTLIIRDCNELNDISNIKESSIENLEILKGYKTIPETLDININDFSIFLKCPKLKNLSLFINENENKEKDLLDLSLLTNLEKLHLPKSYFSFNQFAWLKSKLSNTKNLDSIYHIAKDPANEKIYAVIIGKDKPDFIYDDGSDFISFINEYKSLIDKYKNQDFPPKN